MLRPGEELAVAAGATEAVLSAELALLRLLGRYLTRGLESPAWAERKLAEVQMLRADALLVLRRLDTDLAAAAEDAVAQAYQRGAGAAVVDLPKVPRPPAALAAAMHALGSDLVSTVTGKAPRILRQVEDVYRQVVGEVSAAGVAGVETRKQVTSRALGSFAARGVSGFTDRAGRQWGMEAYTEMAVRSSMITASRVGYEDTLVANGRHLVYVTPGANPCPDCDRWAGKILLLPGGVDPEEVADASMSEARADGHLFGPNCGCGQALYVPGVSDPENVGRGDRERYEAGQRQRAIERHIREWKRREAAALTPEDAARAQGKVREWQGVMREHLAEHEHLRRLSDRERVRPNG